MLDQLHARAAIARGHSCQHEVPSKRVAVLVLASSVALFALWIWMAKWMPSIVQETPIEEFSPRHLWRPVLGEPSFAWVGIAGIVLFIIALLVAGRRPVVHTLATLSVATFLLLGFWLPVASRLWCSAMTAWWEYLDADFQLAHPLALVSWMVVPPIAAATVITHFEARLSRRVIRIGIAIGFACALVSRHGAEVARTRCIGQVPAVDCPSLVFVSFAHLLVAGGLVAFGSLLAIAISRRRCPSGTTHASKRYLAFLAIVGIPNLIAIDQSFGLVAHLDRLLWHWICG
jgi:hypothetical protein